MAAIDLRQISSGAWPYTGTTALLWQEFKIPPRSKVTIFNEDAGATVYATTDAAGDPAGPETPADGGAVGTHRIPIGPSKSLEIRPNAPGQVSGTKSVFIAGSAAGPYTLLIEAD